MNPALAWARTIPPMRGDAWQSIDAHALGLAAWRHVPALVDRIDALEAECALLCRAECGCAAERGECA